MVRSTSIKRMVALAPALFFLVPVLGQAEPMAPSKVETARPHAVAPQPPAASTVPPASQRPKVVHKHERPLDDATKARLKEQALSAPAVAPQTLLATPDDKASKPARLQKDFAGANRLMPEVDAIDPPDTNAAASAHRVLEAVNSGLRMTDFNGTSELRLSLASMFGEPESTFIFDPRVLYDRNSPNPRFIVTTLQRSFSTLTPGESWLHVAVSRSDNPLTLGPSDWCTYKIDARQFDPNIDGLGTPGTRWADFDRVGMGPEALSVVTNEFPFGRIGNIVTQLRVLNKSLLEDNASACPESPVYTFDISAKPADFISAFAAYPVQHYTSPSSFPGASNPAYMIGDSDFGGRDYTIWRITNVAAGAPTVDSIHVNSDILLALEPAPPAKQLGTANVLETGDFGIGGTAGLGDAVWATHSNACNVGGGEEESCIVVLRFVVGQDAAGQMTAAVTQSHTFGGDADGVSFWMPAIAVTKDEQTVVTFQTSSPTTFLSTWFTSKALNDAAYQAPTALTSGTCADPDNGGPGFEIRTGDYVGSMTSPDLKSVWISGERLIPFPPEFGVNICLWETWIGRAVP
jgi:hypothetical protein